LRASFAYRRDFGPALLCEAKRASRMMRRRYKHACRLGAEGILSKRFDGYRSGPSKTWLRSKKPPIKALIVANHFLETELEKLKAAASMGYARGKLIEDAKALPRDRKDWYD
jgi:hypothetical protein